MQKSRSGFTIVELLIVIVVIAILAAISIIGYNGFQTRATNTAAVNELAQWRKSFEAYRAQEGSLPNMANGGYCLGANFPSGSDGARRCRDLPASANSYLESDNTALMSELRKISDLPSGPRIPVNGSVGPYVQYAATAISLTTVLRGNASDCPAPTIFDWTDNNGRVLCSIRINK